MYFNKVVQEVISRKTDWVCSYRCKFSLHILTHSFNIVKNVFLDSSRVFGSCLDIHSGGIDLAFPHHENELAQSCSYHGITQWANYWMHTGTMV